MDSLQAAVTLNCQRPGLEWTVFVCKINTSLFLCERLIALHCTNGNGHDFDITAFQSPRYIQQLIIERRIWCCLCAVFRQSAAEKLQEMITAISSSSATRPLISLQPRHWTLDTWAELTNNIPRNTPHSHPGFPLCQPSPAQRSPVQCSVGYSADRSPPPCPAPS